MQTFIGRKVKVSYENGLVFQVTYLSETKLRWEALEGPKKGEFGEETITSMEVAPGIYFLNWVEEDGLTISQILNLHEMKLNTFMTFDQGEGRQSLFETAIVEDLSAK
ncbi:MoaF N-terminal domain-containing protein [Bacillus sp. XF8]|uniref:MoaF-related domain-containing protein n=1 Tax=Bacillus sp. XF8 TaxID=2819289 RepID=UPI001AA04293|nr:MoaF N-terminal domain-containing protein [Bacillus sp. XF8]MBO1578046.1 MoaF N-terminal domain-containing protein [Bacillus sp. XF8]